MQASETSYFGKVKGTWSWGFSSELLFFGVLSPGYFDGEKDNFPNNGEFKQRYGLETTERSNRKLSRNP